MGSRMLSIVVYVRIRCICSKDWALLRFVFPIVNIHEPLVASSGIGACRQYICTVHIYRRRICICSMCMRICVPAATCHNSHSYHTPNKKGGTIWSHIRRRSRIKKKQHKFTVPQFEIFSNNYRMYRMESHNAHNNDSRMRIGYDYTYNKNKNKNPKPKVYTSSHNMYHARSGRGLSKIERKKNKKCAHMTV